MLWRLTRSGPRIERMIGSDVFSRSPQLGAFLRFVVEAVLHGKADRIKAYTIGVEVLRRDTKFDPQLDPIVRVEATRLRRAIERYYAGPGADRSGHHRSAARLLCADLPAPRDGASAARCHLSLRSDAGPTLCNGRRRAMVAHRRGDGRVSCRSRAVLYGRTRRWHHHGCDRGARFRRRRTPDAAAGQRHADVQIEPLRVIGTPSPSAIAAERLHAKISDAFARFDTINVTSNRHPGECRSRFACRRPARRLSPLRRHRIHR